MFSAFSNDHFMKQNTMENYSPFNSFSYSSGLEFDGFRTTATSNNYASAGTVAAVGNHFMHEQSSPLADGRNCISNGGLTRNYDKLYGHLRQTNMNSLSAGNSVINTRQGNCLSLNVIRSIIPA